MIKLREKEEEEKGGRYVGNATKSKKAYLKIYFERRKGVTSAARTYLMKRVYVQAVEAGEQKVQKVQNKTNRPRLAAPRRAKRKGVFMCGRRNGDELFIGLC